MAAPPDRLARNLYVAGVVFAVGSGVHLVDHLRRGQGSVSEGLYWAGNLALILQVTIVVLVLTRPPAGSARRRGRWVPAGAGVPGRALAARSGAT